MSSAQRNHQDDGEHSSQDRWLVSYADFITLMFAFFAVLYATAEKDIDKTKEFQDSMKRFLVKAGAFGESGQQINQGEKQNSPIEEPIPTFKKDKPEAVKAIDEADAYLESNLKAEDRKKYIKDMATDDWGVRITVPSDVLFAPKSAKFQPGAIEFLDKLSELLQKTNRKILIEGHVLPGETGPFENTWDFSSARAVNVLRFVQKRRGMKGELLAAASMGDSRPIYSGANASLNSRIEIVLLNQDMEW
jgi:chemotaxis protein MotB